MRGEALTRRSLLRTAGMAALAAGLQRLTPATLAGHLAGRLLSRELAAADLRQVVRSIAAGDSPAAPILGLAA